MVSTCSDDLQYLNDMEPLESVDDAGNEEKHIYEASGDALGVSGGQHMLDGNDSEDLSSSARWAQAASIFFSLVGWGIDRTVCLYYQSQSIDMPRRSFSLSQVPLGRVDHRWAPNLLVDLLG